MEWSEIQSPPQGLRSGEQTVSITSVREYRNTKRNRCIELVLENDAGEQLPLFFSIEQEHRGYIGTFLRKFLRTTINRVNRHGGWESLVGRDFRVDVEYLDGTNSNLVPH